MLMFSTYPFFFFHIINFFLFYDINFNVIVIHFYLGGGELCHGACVELRWQIVGAGSLLRPCGQSADSSCEAWWQMPLATEPSLAHYI